jgi:hypothetical protein
MTHVWAGVDIGGGREAVEVEHRVLTALESWDGGPDHVATHVIARAIPGAAATVRFASATPKAAAGYAAGLYGALGGTLVMLHQDDALVLGDPDAAPECARIAAGSRAGVSGRCLRFPGQDHLVGVLSVRAIISSSAIDQVRGSGWPVQTDDLVDTRGFVRPVFEHGSLVLRVGPAAGGLLVPNETAEPHECCSGRH